MYHFELDHILEPSPRSYDLPYLANRKEVYRGGYSHYVWEGLRASTAAPSYFREVEIGGDVHVDGALLYNNPTGEYESADLYTCYLGHRGPGLQLLFHSFMLRYLRTILVISFH
jgi:hypothetical protein